MTTRDTALPAVDYVDDLPEVRSDMSHQLRATWVVTLRELLRLKQDKARMVTMLLQPVLENAIFHGAKGLERKLNIEVAAKLEGNGRCLTVTIRDDGVGFEEEAVRNLLCQEPDEASAHIGLLNVRERIRLRFGDEYGLRIERDEGMTTVALSMPYKTLEPGEDVHVESQCRRLPEGILVGPCAFRRPDVESCRLRDFCSHVFMRSVRFK